MTDIILNIFIIKRVVVTGGAIWARQHKAGQKY